MLDGEVLADEILDAVDAQFAAPPARTAAMLSAIDAQWIALIDYVIAHAEDLADLVEPHLPGGGGGEANTGSNVGAAGTGVFDGKVGVDLQFRKIRAASSKVTVALNAQQVDVDVAPANFTGIPQAGVTDLVTDLALKAPIASPTLTGTPAAPTAAGGTNTTQLATTQFVQTAIASVINSAPGALDTLDELAAALGDDANYAATITTALAGKQPLDAGLSSLAALGATVGLIEKTATDTYTERALGVAASTSVPTRGDADTRYASRTVTVDQRILGLISGAPANVAQLRITEVLDWLGVAHGDVLFRADTTWSVLPAGVNGEFLKTRGAGVNPMWDTPVGGSGDLAMSKHVLGANTTVTAAYSCVVSRYLEVGDSFTLELGDDADLEIA